MRSSFVRAARIAGSVIPVLLCVAVPVAALGGDALADAALGQPDLQSVGCGNTAVTLCQPTGVAVDPLSGRLFVSDTGFRNSESAGNSRILSWANRRRLASGEAADLVLGESNFTSSEGVCADPANPVGPVHPVAEHLCQPGPLAVDSSGRVYVADQGNERVLRFSPPFVTAQLPDLVLGESDFETAPDVRVIHVGRGGQLGTFCPNPPRISLCSVTAMAVDSHGSLWVTDSEAGLLRFEAPSTNGQAPDLVSTCAAPNVVGIKASTLCHPGAVAADTQGAIYVLIDFSGTDASVLRFSQATQPDPSADLVIHLPNIGIFNQIAVDRSGNLYLGLLAGTGGAVVRVDAPLTSTSVVGRTFGSPAPDCGPIGFGPNFTSAAVLCEVAGLALDFRGDLWVADESENRVVRYDSAINGTQPVP